MCAGTKKTHKRLLTTQNLVVPCSQVLSICRMNPMWYHFNCVFLLILPRRYQCAREWNFLGMALENSTSLHGLMSGVREKCGIRLLAWCSDGVGWVPRPTSQHSSWIKLIAHNLKISCKMKTFLTATTTNIATAFPLFPLAQHLSDYFLSSTSAVLLGQ